MARRLSGKLLQRSSTWLDVHTPALRTPDSQGLAQALISRLRHLSTAAAPPGVAGSVLQGGLQQLTDLPGIYKQLSKAKLSGLVVSTAAAGFVAGSGTEICWNTLGWTALGTMGAASAANTLNQVREVHQDSLMKRTCRRPLPLRRISRLHALGFAAVMGTAGVALLALKTNWLTASLGVANIGLYAGVYTPLKMISPVNTWVGALVGAIPPLMGWAAASGGLDVGAGIYAGILYFWQIPHFLALAWLCRADYARGGYRMLSTVDASGRRTGACMLRNSLYLLPLGPAAMAAGVAGPVFACTASVATGVFSAMAAAFARTPTSKAARGVFRASLIYLPIVMAVGLWDRVPHEGASEQRHTDNATCNEDESSPHSRDNEQLQGQSNDLMTMPPFPFLPVPIRLYSPAMQTSTNGQGSLAGKQTLMALPD